MIPAVEGTVKNGKMELDETPPGLEGLRVRVTFLPPEQPRPAGVGSTPGRRIAYGMFKGAWCPTTEEDFADAEWRGDRDEGADHGNDVRR